MSIFHCSNKLLLSASRRYFSSFSGVFNSFCLVHKARLYSLCLPHRFTPCFSSCQLHVFNRHCDTKRFYSEMITQSNPIKNSGLSQEEQPAIESERTEQRSPETFTLDVLVSLLRQENAVDICVIKVPDQIKYAQYFIVASGISPRHLRAMALYSIKVYKFLKKEVDPNVKIEGKDSEDWICIDFGGMVVHFMLPKTREVYELEKLWTLRKYDEQLKSIPEETLPEDFIYDAEVTK